MKNFFQIANNESPADINDICDRLDIKYLIKVADTKQYTIRFTIKIKWGEDVTQCCIDINNDILFRIYEPQEMIMNNVINTFKTGLNQLIPVDKIFGNINYKTLKIQSETTKFV
jgi:hypothetical protein